MYSSVCSVSAPKRIVKRLTTFVMATKPTFWLKEVMGGQPRKRNDAERLNGLLHGREIHHPEKQRNQ